jgi:hypothetical protein
LLVLLTYVYHDTWFRNRTVNLPNCTKDTGASSTPTTRIFLQKFGWNVAFWKGVAGALKTCIDCRLWGRSTAMLLAELISKALEP